MSELRWILLLFGLIVVVAVYLLGRRSGGARQGHVILRHEPKLGDAVGPVAQSGAPETRASPGSTEDGAVGAEADVSLEDPWERSETRSDFGWDNSKTAEPAQRSLDEDQKIFSFRVAARDPLGFAGTDVLRTLKDEDLRHGKYGIFHRLYKDDEDALIFSVASMTEPGSFDLAVIDSIRIPGLSFFMVLPGPQEASFAFAEMLASARRVADRLAGELQDHSGSTLSAQRASNLREEIINFEYQAGLRQRSQHH